MGVCVFVCGGLYSYKLVLSTPCYCKEERSKLIVTTDTHQPGFSDT